MSRLPAAHDHDGWVAQLAHPQRRPDAKAHLIGAGADALPAVRRGMQHPKPIVRRMCANLLDKLADEKAFADLVRALDDTDIGVSPRKRSLLGDLWPTSQSLRAEQVRPAASRSRRVMPLRVPA